jgi:hypothetical protein
MVFTQFATNQAAQTAAYTRTLLAQNSREVTSFLVNIACQHEFLLTKDAGLKKYTCVLILRKALMFMITYIGATTVLFSQMRLLNRYQFGEAGCDSMINEQSPH